VNRGYVHPDQGTAVPAIAPPPSETVTIIGRLRDSQPAGDKQPFTDAGYQQVYAIDTRQISRLIGTPLTGSYVQLIENQPGVLEPLALPRLDAGPFLSYGIQWIAFGIIAPIGLGYFVYSEIKTRRAEAARKAEQQGSTQPLTTEQKLDDRYGRRR
jgi:cytochrome oxidase assembly protein ShyY1